MTDNIMRKLTRLSQQFQELRDRVEVSSGGGGAPSGWTDDGTAVRLTTSTDNVGVGTVSPSAKLDVTGDADEVQLAVQANATQTSNIVEVQNSSGTALTMIDNAGKVGIGASPSYQFHVQSSTSNAAIPAGIGYMRGLTTVSTNQTKTQYAFWLDNTYQAISAGVTESGARTGVLCNAYANTTNFRGTLATQYGLSGQAGILTASSGATINNATAGFFKIYNRTAGATMGNAFGVYIENAETTGNITNRYGLFIVSQTSGYAIYTGGGLNRLGDQLDIDGSADRVQLKVQANVTQTANTAEIQDSAGSVMTAIAKNGAWKPPQLADTAAEINTVYYSTTQSKLVYKDPGGVVNNLY